MENTALYKDCEQHHPSNPRSNVAKVGKYDPDKYTINQVPITVRTNEALTPNQPPSLTQQAIGKYLIPLTRELDESPPSPTIAEFPDTVINRMVRKDKAFWVDKPGANAYVLHDAYYKYGMTSEKVLPPHQEVFPRSYQYDLDCVTFRRRHACDGLKSGNQKPVSAHCRDCSHLNTPGLTPFQLAWAQDPGQKRWRYYPDLTNKLTKDEIQALMNEVGRPFHSEACNWYNKNYPSIKFDTILRKFSK